MVATCIMTFQSHGQSKEDLYARRLLRSLLSQAQLKSIDAVLEFAMSNKLLSTFLSLGMLDIKDCATAIDKQKAARRAARESLCAIQREFSVVGVRYVVMKGLAFEKAIYGSPHMRDVGDIDILVKIDDVPRAHERLCQMGYRQQLGPSSGSIASLGRARFAARVSQQKYADPEAPLRRFPYKDAYCPYVKPGYPAVELHDGFRGLPDWYIGEVVERACDSRLSLMEDKLDTAIFLLANTYENAESFYSNCFDDKIVLRDFVDLACYFQFAGSSIAWDEAEELVRKLCFEEKAGRVLYDLDCLLPGEADGILSGIPRLESLWNMSVSDRVSNVAMCRRSVYRVVRSDMRSLAGKSRIGLLVAAEDSLTSIERASGSVAYSLSESKGGVILRVGDVVAKRDGSCLVELGFFPIAGVEPPLCWRISVLLEGDSPVAYCRELDRIADGFTMWSPAGTRLPSSYGDNNEICVDIPREVAATILRRGETAISAGVYDRKCGNVFWARCRGKAMLTGDVPIGSLSLYCGTGIANITVDLSFARCAISSNDGRLLASLCAVFDRASLGTPVDCDGKPVRGYTAMREATGAYTVEADGLPLERGLSREETSSLLVQAVTDWAVSELLKESVLAHASSNLAGDGAVLCMGPSGSGKTSLSLALARWWPLRGDECSCVDFGNGTTWTEPLPLNVKASNDFALELASRDEALTCESGVHGRTFCFNRHIVECDPNPLDRVRIKAIIFPMYDEKASGVEIGSVPCEKLIPLTLGSLLGEGRPSNLLSRFTRMVSACDTKLLSVRYSDAATAARDILELLEGQERGCDVQTG